MLITEFTTRIIEQLYPHLPSDERISAVELLAALRTQSRALVPSAELTAVERRLLYGKTGPGGSEPEADAARAAFLLIATMLNPRREGSAVRVWTLWNLFVEGSRSAGYGKFPVEVNQCELTGAPLFGEALKTILTVPALVRLVDQVRIATSHTEAAIYHSGNRVSLFRRPGWPWPPPLAHAAELDGATLRDIAALVTR